MVTLTLPQAVLQVLSVVKGHRWPLRILCGQLCRSLLLLLVAPFATPHDVRVAVVVVSAVAMPPETAAVIAVVGAGAHLAYCWPTPLSDQLPTARPHHTYGLHYAREKDRRCQKQVRLQAIGIALGKMCAGLRTPCRP